VNIREHSGPPPVTFNARGTINFINFPSVNFQQPHGVLLSAALLLR
jgi:hypothetical protein